MTEVITQTPEPPNVIERDDDPQSDLSEHSDSVPALPAPSPPVIGLQRTVSTDSDDNDISKMSRRESIRAKLRAQEMRLSNLVRNTSTDGSILSEMATVQASLKQVEKEKTDLELELAKLKNATEGDDFLRDKMDGIQEGFQKQLKKIHSLEDEVIAKNSEIESLRQELVAKLRRIVELEFDLETHEVHYTDYAAEQFKLGEEALAEIKSKEREMVEAGQESFASLNSESSVKKRLSPRRAQKLISKLLSDLDSLEARYKDEKLESSSKIESLTFTVEELRTKIIMLEQSLDSKKSEDPEDSSESNSSEDMNNVFFLRKRVQTLEAKRALYRREMDRLQGEMKEMRKESESDARKVKITVGRLELENEALKARVRALETGIMEENDGNLKDFAIVQKRIQENYNDIAKLEAAAEIKDRQIATLKKEVANLRMKEIAQGDIKDKPYSDFDTELLRSTAARLHKSFDDDRSGVTEGTDTSLITELQHQLQEAQQQLVKKDQELVIERAKAASTAAGLLARITELTGKKGEGRSSNKVPLRFYL